MKNVFRTFWRFILAPLFDLVYPPSCMVCHAPDLENDDTLKASIQKYQLCPGCIKSVVEISTGQCPRCGASLFLIDGPPKKEKPERSSFNQPAKIRMCRHCFPENAKYEKIVSLGHYDGLLRHLVLKTKKDYSGLVTRSLTRLLLHERENELRKFDPDLIVPVPMYFGRFLRRGICAPVQMAEILSKELNIPWRLAIKRVHSTQLQWGLGPIQRKKNVHGAFLLAPEMIEVIVQKVYKKTIRNKSVNKKNNKRSNRKKQNEDHNKKPSKVLVKQIEKKISKLQDKRILIVDDILTTGVTCDEIARLLVEAGASSVMVAVFARATGEHNAR